MKVSILVGGKFHSVDLGLQLKKRGHLSQFITTRAEVKSYLGGVVTAIAYPEYVGWAWRRLPWLNNRIHFSLLKDNLFDVMAARYLKPCDVLVAWSHFALFTMRRAKQWGVKVVLERGSAHILTHRDLLVDEYSRFGLGYEIHPLVLRKQLLEYDEADIIMVPSHFVYESFITHGVDPRKLRVIPYGIDATLFVPPREPREEAKFRILFVGSIELTKGVQYLLQAVKELRLRNSEVILIGQPDFTGRILLKEYQDLCHHIPHVPHQGLVEYYQAASVLLLPSLSEGQAMVTSEAMACGLPVIVSSNAGALARDGVDGFVVPPGDVSALKEKLLYLYEHRLEAREMGGNAQQYVSENCTWDHYGEKVIGVYREMLGFN